MRKQELHPRTSKINQKQKSKSKEARLDALRWLAQQFPKAFDNTLSIQPLKHGIMQDILAHADKAQAVGISKSKLREAVVVFTRRIDYLTALKAREMRIDLNGEFVSEVTEDEAEHAAAKIKKRIEKSAKNAKKATTQKFISDANSPHFYHRSGEHQMMYAEEHHSGRLDQNSTQSTKTTSVIIKQKNARQYDPEAVARLKAKLGLAQKQQEEIN